MLIAHVCVYWHMKFVLHFQDSQRSPDLDSPGSGEFPNIMPEYGCGPLQYDIYTTIGMVKYLTLCVPIEFSIKYNMCRSM